MIFVEKLSGGTLWGVRSPSYSPTLYRICKSVPGLRWMKPHWAGYRDAVALVIAMAKRQNLFIQSMDPETSEAFEFDSSALRAYQKDGVEFVLNHAHEGALLADDCGLGRQHSIDTKVLTPSGWRSIGDLHVGDKIIGSSGRVIQRTVIGRLDAFTEGIGKLDDGLKEDLRGQEKGYAEVLKGMFERLEAAEEGS